MATILLIIQIFIIVTLCILVLIQKNSSDGLAGLSGGGHNFISAKSAAGALNKLTMFFVIAFMVNSITIAKLHLHETKAVEQIISTAEEQLDSVQVPVVE